MVQEKIKEFIEVLVAKEQYEIELKELNKKITAMGQEIYDEMVEQDVDKITVDGLEFKQHVETDYVLGEEYSGAQWDKVPEWFAWLKDTGNDGLIKTIESVPWNTRKKFLKEWADAGNEMPVFVKEKYFTTVKYNKSAIARMVKGE